MITKTFFSSALRSSALLLFFSVSFFSSLLCDPDSPARPRPSAHVVSTVEAPSPATLSPADRIAAQARYWLHQYAAHLQEKHFAEYVQLYEEAAAEIPPGEDPNPSLRSVIEKRVQKLMETLSIQTTEELLLARKVVQVLLEESLLIDPDREEPSTQSMPPVITYLSQRLVAMNGLGQLPPQE